MNSIQGRRFSGTWMMLKLLAEAQTAIKLATKIFKERPLNFQLCRESNLALEPPTGRGGRGDPAAFGVQLRVGKGWDGAEPRVAGGGLSPPVLRWPWDGQHRPGRSQGSSSPQGHRQPRGKSKPPAQLPLGTRPSAAFLPGRGEASLRVVFLNA